MPRQPRDATQCVSGRHLCWHPREAVEGRPLGPAQAPALGSGTGLPQCPPRAPPRHVPRRSPGCSFCGGRSGRRAARPARGGNPEGFSEEGVGLGGFEAEEGRVSGGPAGSTRWRVLGGEVCRTWAEAVPLRPDPGTPQGRASSQRKPPPGWSSQSLRLQSWVRGQRSGTAHFLPSPPRTRLALGRTSADSGVWLCFGPSCPPPGPCRPQRPSSARPGKLGGGFSPTFPGAAWKGRWGSWQPSAVGADAQPQPPARGSPGTCPSPVTCLPSVSPPTRPAQPSVPNNLHTRWLRKVRTSFAHDGVASEDDKPASRDPTVEIWSVLCLR